MIELFGLFFVYSLMIIGFVVVFGGITWIFYDILKEMYFHSPIFSLVYKFKYNKNFHFVDSIRNDYGLTVAKIYLRQDGTHGFENVRRCNKKDELKICRRIEKWNRISNKVDNTYTIE